MQIKTKRIYLPTTPDDGFRVLVERLWPKGLKKEEAHIELWFKLIAPTADLRKQLEQEPNKWLQFKEHYFKELDVKKDLITHLLLDDQQKTLTLLHSSQDETHNSAIALKEYLESIVNKH